MLMERRPQLSTARCEPVIAGTVLDQDGKPQPTHMPGERALTLYLDKREIVTLMTLGQNPEALVLGYLRNQRLVENLRDIGNTVLVVEHDPEMMRAADCILDIGPGAGELGGQFSGRFIVAGVVSLVVGPVQPRHHGSDHNSDYR